MAVTVRLARIGKKNAPFYRIVVLDSRKKRDGAFLEDLGTYDGLHNKLVTFHEEHLNAWIEKGAQLSDTVKKIHKLYKAEGIKEISAKKVVIEPVAQKEVKKESEGLADPEQ